MLTRILAILISSLAISGVALGESVDTIHTLIEQANPGDEIRIPPGIYEGNLRVEKSVTLLAENDATIDALGEGIVVHVIAPDVKLRGLTIRGSAKRVMNEPSGVRAERGPITIENCTFEDVLFGIDLRGASDSVIRGNTISGYDLEAGRRGDGVRLWWSHGCVIENNTVKSVRDMVFWYSEDLIIKQNTVEDSRYGLHCMYSHNSVFRENELARNSVGIYLMYSNDITLENNQLTENRGASGYGIGLKDCDNIIVASNTIMANRVGVYIDNSPSSVDALGIIENNSIAFNVMGMLMTPITHDVVVTGNGLIENEEQVAVHGAGDLSLNTFSYEGRGNYWSDYAGFDGDGDSIGDMPHEAASLFETLLAREPNLRIFVHSPAQQAVEFTSRALPEIRPEPKFVDEFPLTERPVLRPLAVTPSSPLPLAFSGIALVGGACISLLFAGRTRGSALALPTKDSMS